MTPPDEEVFARHTFCQLCGYTPDDESKEPIRKWRVYTFNSLEGISIHVVACPTCRGTPHDIAFSVYRKRVAAGLDINFH